MSKKVQNSQYNYFTDHLSQLKRGLIEALADKIAVEGTESGYTDSLGIKISIDIYTYLITINGCLTLLDCDGYQYNLWCANIEDLIEILNS